MINRVSIILLCLSTLIFSQSMIPDLSNEEIEQLKVQLQNNKPLSKSDTTIGIQKNTPQAVSVKSTSVNPDSRYFGYSFFTRNIDFFDNIPTPANYKLGPGDEIILSLWGDVNSRENFVINKEGLIFYQNIGFINLSNKSIPQAEDLLKEKLSQIYSSLQTEKNTSMLRLELGKLKSINVYFTGQIKTPGINLIHPFSDVFTAIVQAGGVKLTGSLRNVQLIRNGQIVETFDFYNFFLGGTNDFSEIKILDGDVINIPVNSSRVQILGEVINPGFYEFKKGDVISNVIEYSGGLKGTASTNALLQKIIPSEIRSSEDTPNQTLNITSQDFSKIEVNLGDSINILGVDSNNTTVEVLGAVKSPGFYGYESTLKEVLDIAGGFNDPVYRKSIKDDITVLRKDENQILSEKLEVKYENSNSFELFPGDKILVYRNPNFNKSLTFQIKGEVNQPGIYPLSFNLTVGEALKMAGGLTPLSSEMNVVVTEEFSIVDSQGNARIVKNTIANADYNFVVSKNTVITANPFENIINVSGNVYNPGLIAYSKNLRFSDAVRLAGGYKPDSLKNRAYIIRTNGEIVYAKKRFFNRGIKIFPGDSVFIPSKTEKEIDFNAFLRDISATLLNLVSIFILIDRVDNP